MRSNALLLDKDEKIDYEGLIKRYPWIIEPNQKCILSPDSDGLLCGLFMSNYLNWKVVGYYDGKILALKEGESVKDCVFLDMEIFRNHVKSLGHHMVMHDKNRVPENWGNFDNCIQPNNIRGYDAKTSFKLKYPFGAIHLILGIIGYKKKIEIKKEAICPLLYTDGTFKNLFNYPDNCLSWLNFLHADKEDSPLKKIFFNDHYTISSLMLALGNFFEQLRQINDGSKGADKIRFSNSRGESLLENDGESFKLVREQKEVAEKFLNILSDLTGWEYKENNWIFDNFNMYKFKKEITQRNNTKFSQLMSKNPLSLAMTSTLEIEYTLEEPARLP